MQDPPASGASVSCTQPGVWPTLAATTGIQALMTMSALTMPVLAALMAPDLQRPAAMVAGYCASVVYLGAIIGSMASGALVGRMGAIRVSQLSLTLCAMGLCLASVPNLSTVLAGAFTIGLGYGPVTPASSHLLARSTPAHCMSLVFSLKQTGVPLGGLLAGAIAPGLGVALGWGRALWCVAGACIVMDVLAQLLRASLDRDRDRTATVHLAGLVQPLRLVLGRAALRKLAAISLLFSFAQVALTAFAVVYVHDSLKFDLVVAGLVLSIAQGGGICGRIAWGYVCDAWFGPRRTLRLLATLMAVAAVVTGLLTPAAPLVLVAITLLVFGATAIGWNGVYLAEVARQAPPALAGAATGGTLVFTYLGNVLGPAAFGGVSQHLGGFGMAYTALALPLLAAAWLLRSPSEPAAAG